MNRCQRVSDAELDGVIARHAAGVPLRLLAAELGVTRQALYQRISLRAQPRAPRAPGWQARGENHCRAKLTEVDVRAIRACDTARRGCMAALARHYGVSPVTIADVIARRTWKHVR